MRSITLALLGCLALAPAAHALSAGDALPGFQCAAVPQAEHGQLPPVLDRPNGQQINLGGATVIVAPKPPVRGFVEVLLPNGRYGWVDAARLAPWRNASNPSAVCIPFVNAAGMPGIRYRDH